MKQNITETLVGFIVIIVALTFFVFAYKSANRNTHADGYTVKASFQSAEGITKGSDVLLAGVKIGTVSDIALDKTSFFAWVSLNVEKGIKLPKDTRLEVATSGILGSRYISVIPGDSEEILTSGDQIKYTQSAINLESLIGKLIYSFGGNNKK